MLTVFCIDIFQAGDNKEAATINKMSQSVADLVQTAKRVRYLYLFVNVCQSNKDYSIYCGFFRK